MTSSLSCVTAPASVFTNVCEKPPAAGTVWKNEPAIEAAPTATNSCPLSSGGSLMSRVLRATVALSRNASRAIANA